MISLLVERSRRSMYILLLLVALLALALRLYRLDGQSLWNDEGTSVALAQRDLPTITRSAAADIHPPLYYYLLRAWITLAGTSEMGVRSLSVLGGVLLVLVTFALGRRLAGARIGLLAAFLSAISPSQVYYSQETRMYVLVALLGAASVYLTAQWLAAFGANTAPASLRVNWLTLVAYVAVTSAALYTHYFAFTVVLAEALAVLLVAVGWYWRGQVGADRTRSILSWLGALLASGVLYLPWLGAMRQQWATWPATSTPFSLPDLLVRAAADLSLGRSADPSALWPAVVLLTAVLLLGLLPLGRRIAAPDGYLIATLYLFVPVLSLYLLSLRRPFYDSKFLLVASPAYFLIVAQGLENICPLLVKKARAGPLLAGLALGGMIVASGISLHNYYWDARYARDDYRGIARYIEALGRPGDAILLNAPGQIETFEYYYRGEFPRHPLPRQRPLEEGPTQAELRSLVETSRRIWAIYWATAESDPKRFIESWLDSRCYKAQDRWYGNVRLALYAVATEPSVERMQKPLGVSLGDGIVLLGYTLWAGEVRAGEIIPLTLYWQPRQPIGTRYKVFAHVIDRADNLWGQRDAEPGGGARITTVWKPGEVIADNYGIPVLPGTPPGEYQIEVGMYGLESGRRLPVTDEQGQPLGDRLLLGPVRIDRGTFFTSKEVPRPTSLVFDGQLKLLGYRLGRLGQDEETGDFKSDDVLHLTLFWQALKKANRDLLVGAYLTAANDQIVLRREVGPADGSYPTKMWEAGEIVRDQHRLVLSGLRPGQYRLLLGLIDASSRQVLKATGSPKPLPSGLIELGKINLR